MPIPPAWWTTGIRRCRCSPRFALSDAGSALTVTAQGGELSTGGFFGSATRDGSLRLGWSFQPWLLWTAALSAGPSMVETDAGSDSGFVFDSEIKRQGDRWSLTANAGRSQSPTGRGVLTRRDECQVELQSRDHRTIERQRRGALGAQRRPAAAAGGAVTYHVDYGSARSRRELAPVARLEPVAAAQRQHTRLRARHRAGQRLSSFTEHRMERSTSIPVTSRSRSLADYVAAARRRRVPAHRRRRVGAGHRAGGGVLLAADVSLHRHHPDRAAGSAGRPGALHGVELCRPAHPGDQPARHDLGEPDAHHRSLSAVSGASAARSRAKCC